MARGVRLLASGVRRRSGRRRTAFVEILQQLGLHGAVESLLPPDRQFTESAALRERA
jgi:hypothetical protein